MPRMLYPRERLLEVSQSFLLAAHAASRMGNKDLFNALSDLSDRVSADIEAVLKEHEDKNKLPPPKPVRKSKAATDREEMNQIVAKASADAQAERQVREQARALDLAFTPTTIDSSAVDERVELFNTLSPSKLQETMEYLKYYHPDMIDSDGYYIGDAALLRGII